MEEKTAKNSSPEKSSEQKGFATIRTLKGDAEKYIKEKNVSLISIFSKKTKKETRDFKKEKKSKIISIIGTLIIVILVLAALGLGYKIFLKPKTPAPKEPSLPRPFIFSDEIRPIRLTTGDFAEITSKIAENFQNQYSYNTFIYLPILKNEKVLETEKFFKTLEISPPSDFLKSVDKDFLLAVYTDNNRFNNFILAFKVNFYERAYRAILEWEDEILEDLAPILPAGLQVQKIIFENNAGDFYDKVISNLDARILETNDGKPLIVYAFFARKFLVITTSEETFKTAIDRLKISLSE